MKKAANDNTDTWIKLAAATANLVRYLELGDKKQENGERDAQHDHDEKEIAEQHRRAIDQGLRQIASFEERAAGQHVRIRRK